MPGALSTREGTRDRSRSTGDATMPKYKFVLREHSLAEAEGIEIVEMQEVEP